MVENKTLEEKEKLALREKASKQMREIAVQLTLFEKEKEDFAIERSRKAAAEEFERKKSSPEKRFSLQEPEETGAYEKG